MKVFTTHLDQNLMTKMISIENNRKQQNRHKATKCLNCLKSLGKVAKDLMEEIEDADNDIDIHQLVFIGSNLI